MSLDLLERARARVFGRAVHTRRPSSERQGESGKHAIISRKSRTHADYGVEMSVDTTKWKRENSWSLPPPRLKIKSLNEKEENNPLNYIGTQGLNWLGEPKIIFSYLEEFVE